MGLSQSKPPPPGRGRYSHYQHYYHTASDHHDYHYDPRRRRRRRHHSRRSSLPVLPLLPSPAPAPPAPAPTMPAFFSFQQGSERTQNAHSLSESSPLLGRYRAVPRPDAGRLSAAAAVQAHGQGQLGLLSTAGIASPHGGAASAKSGWRKGAGAGGGAPAVGGYGYAYGTLGFAAAEVGGVEEEEGEREEEREDEGDGGGDGGCCCSGKCWRRFSRRVRWVLRRLEDTWVDPKASVVRGVVDVWWSRWGTLVALPALLVGSLLFCLLASQDRAGRGLAGRGGVPPGRGLHGG